MLRHICHRRHHAYIGQCWPTWWKSVASTTHKERKCAIRAILKIYIFYTFACVHSFYADVYEKLLNWNAVKYNNHNEKLNEWNIFSLFGERCWCSCHSHTWTMLMYWGRWSKKVPKSPIPNIILPKSPFFQNRINQWSVLNDTSVPKPSILDTKQFINWDELPTYESHTTFSSIIASKTRYEQFYNARCKFNGMEYVLVKLVCKCCCLWVQQSLYFVSRPKEEKKAPCEYKPKYFITFIYSHTKKNVLPIVKRTT